MNWDALGFEDGAASLEISVIVDDSLTNSIAHSHNRRPATTSGHHFADWQIRFGTDLTTVTLHIHNSNGGFTEPFDLHLNLCAGSGEAPPLLVFHFADER